MCIRESVLIAEQEKAVGQVQSELIEAQDEYNRIQTEINKLKDEFFAFMRSLADQRNVQRSFDDRRANLEAQIKGVAEELKRLDGQLATLSEQYEQLRLAEKALVEKDAEQKREEERLLKELRAQEILFKEKQEQSRRGKKSACSRNSVHRRFSLRRSRSSTGSWRRNRPDLLQG